MNSNVININIDDLSEEKLILFNDIKEMRGGDELDVFEYLLEVFERFEKVKTTGVRQNDTLAYINDLVHRQININKTTGKVHVIGNGLNAKDVKYEQRAITDRWVMGASIKERDAKVAGARAVNKKLVQKYINLNKEEIDEHHKWLCDQAGLKFTPENVLNFNRRTSKASAAIAKLEQSKA